MIDIEQKRIQAICEVAGVKEIEDVNDGHTEKDVTRLLSLEQEPYEECISKQAVLTAMRNNYRGGGRDIYGAYVEGSYKKELYDAIISLPPVSSQSRKVWITTYWTKGIEPVVTPFDNQEAAETCARYYEKQGYKVCIDECDIFHKCINIENEE